MDAHAHLIRDIDLFLQQVVHMPQHSTEEVSVSGQTPSQSSNVLPPPHSSSEGRFPAAGALERDSQQQQQHSQLKSAVGCDAPLCVKQRQHLNRELRRATDLLKASMGQWETERTAHRRTQQHLKEAMMEIKALRGAAARGIGIGRGLVVDGSANRRAAEGTPRRVDSVGRSEEEEEEREQDHHRYDGSRHHADNNDADESSLRFVSPVKQQQHHHHYHHHNNSSSGAHAGHSDPHQNFVLRDLFEKAANSPASKWSQNRSTTPSTHHRRPTSGAASGSGVRSSDGPPSSGRKARPLSSSPRPAAASVGVTAFSSSSPRFYPPLHGTTTPQRDQGHSFCFYQTSARSGLEAVTRQEAVAMLLQEGREEEEQGGGTVTMMSGRRGPPLRSPPRPSPSAAAAYYSVGEERDVGFALDDLRRRLVGGHVKAR